MIPSTFWVRKSPVIDDDDDDDGGDYNDDDNNDDNDKEVDADGQMMMTMMI